MAEDSLNEHLGASNLPTVSVVVPTYNRRDLLPVVLGPLLADPAAREVIVVVDGCSDGSFELLQGLAAAHPNLKPIQIKNSGQTAAQAAGLEQVTSDVVLLLDDDVVPDAGLVSGHARHHSRGSGLVVVGYMPTLIPRSRTSSTFATILYAQEYEYAVRRYIDYPEQILQELWMGNISIKCDDCRRIGLFNPKWATIGKFYHVDRDFGLRCWKDGMTGVFDSSLSGTHLMTRTLSGYLRYAHEQGVGRVAIHNLHSDILDPISLESFTEDLRWPARHLVRAARRPAVYRSILAISSGWIELVGRARLTALQTPVARLARRIELVRGAREALSRDQGSTRPSTSAQEPLRR